MADDDDATPPPAPEPPPEVPPTAEFFDLDTFLLFAIVASLPKRR